MDLMEDPRAFAEACRAAGLKFMRGIALGWEESDLERWRSRQYDTLAVAPRDVVRKTPAGTSASARIPTISDLLREARWKVFAALEQAAHGDTGFVQTVAGERLIVRDVKGWAPVHRQGASLHGRVLSLFAVDCLVRPADYSSLLLACPRCESIVFDARAREQGQCCGDRIVGSGRYPSPESSDSVPSARAPETKREPR